MKYGFIRFVGGLNSTVQQFKADDIQNVFFVIQNKIWSCPSVTKYQGIFLSPQYSTVSS